ncbi:polyprenyl synthetase [Streptomyces sp. NPDC049837]|uniref:polyprenyl synthetase n=1 Tax=Streptomyces sp. NPDC049837 TaxID=3155277 RepID=UPI003435A679
MGYQKQRDGVLAGNELVQLAAGAADLAFSGLSSAFRSARGLLRRADVPELAAEGRRELTARGRLVLHRLPAATPPHMETLARHAMARRTGVGDV